MASTPPILLFADRMTQGPLFNLTSVEWTRNILPPYHGHDFPEVFWITDGRCEHRINNQSQVLEPGTLVLMRPRDFHGLLPVRGKRFSFTNIAIEPGCWASLLQRYPDPLDRLYDTQAPLPWVSRLAGRELDALAEDTRRLAGRPHSRFNLERFLINTWERCTVGPRSLTGDGSGAPAWLSEARLRIQEPEMFHRGVEAFVELCNRSHEHVSRECRKHYGKSPSQLVNQARLAHAAEALRTTTRSVTEIALDCGFEAPGRFYAIFRKAYGTTPLRYRHPQ